MSQILDDHARVFLTLVDVDAVLTALDGEVPDGQALPYVLVYFAFRTPSGVDEPELVSLEATSDVLTTTATCHSVGTTQASARVTASRVRTALLGKFPALSGRLCYPIVYTDGPPMRRDETTGDTLFDQVDVYEFTSQPG